jgi:hypothetical protein
MSGHVYLMSAQEVLSRLGGLPRDRDLTAEEVLALRLHNFREHAFRCGYVWHKDWSDDARRGNVPDPVRGPELEHSEWVQGVSWRYWDLPGHPSRLVNACTPCPAEDLGQPEPEEPGWWAVPRWFTCRLKHVHHGTRPSRDKAPPEVRERISRALGEE